VLYILQGKWGEQREELRVTPPRKRYLTEHEHRALQLLAGSPRGVTEELRVPGYGFKLQMLTGLADAKLGEAVPRERQRRRPNDWGHLHDDHRRRTEGAQGAARDGSSRAEAATNAGMDRQTLRDRVIRFNEQGPDGLVNIPSPGAPPKLNDTHKAFLARIVDEGAIPAIHGVVRWRACDLIMRLHEAFGLSPKRWRLLKKLLRPPGGNSPKARIGHFVRSVVPGRDAGRPEEQAHLSLGHEGFTSASGP
jgi:transposase